MQVSDSGMFAGRVYARHAGPLMRLAVRLAGPDWQQAEDLAQEVMLRAWAHRHAIPDGGERAWLAVTARNLAVDVRRRRRARQVREEQYARLNPPWAAGDPAGRVADAVTVAAAVAALSPRRRAVIAELYYAGRTVAETAAVLGIPPGTVKSRAFYALAALREALAGHTEGAGS
jgi:RNA polymerase sigma-70 factor, ECF subfamily